MPWGSSRNCGGSLSISRRRNCASTRATSSALEGVRSPRVLGSVALPVVLSGLVIAAAFFPSEVRPLVPALQNSDLLAIHVAAMILAYAALSVSFASATLYLLQGAKNRFDQLPKAKLLDEIG